MRGFNNRFSLYQHLARIYDSARIDVQEASGVNYYRLV